MKVILLQDVPKVGKKGDIKEVSDGLANNMLLRKNLAVMATKEAQSKLIKEQRDKSQKQQRLLEKHQTEKRELEKRTFTVKVKVGDKGQIFAGVHEKDILEAVHQKTKIELEKSQVDSRSIKHLGLHTIKIKLGLGVTAEIKINIESK